MAWNDNLTKELDNYLNRVRQLGPKAVEAARKTIDDESKQVYDKIKQSIELKHNDTGGLANSLKLEPDGNNGYGSHKNKVFFDGENEEGIAYQKIANTLNKGRAARVSNSGEEYGAITGTHFTDDAISGLRGLTGRINENIDKVLKDN